MVAGEDSLIDKDELHSYEEVLRDSEFCQSAHARQLFSKGFDNFMHLTREYAKGKVQKDPKIIETVIRVINTNLKPANARACKEDIYRLAEAIAKSSGKMFRKISEEERKVLDELRRVLQLDVPDLTKDD